MDIDDILKFSDTGESISYKCIVDVSGSMSQERIDLAKDYIKAIGQKKKPDDNLAITAFGNDLIQSDYMTDPTEIEEKANILTLTHEDTNLYYGIVEELKGMQTNASVHQKKCLIIFSDGAEDQATGITREEAEKETESSHIPIFTVALLKNGYKEADEESAKILGSFARLSSGGIHFAPALGDGDINSIPDIIISRLQNSLVLKESLHDVEVSGKEVVLQADITLESGQSANDKINVPEGDIKLIQKEIERIEASEPEPEPDPEPEPVSEPAKEESTEESKIFGLPATTFYLIVSGLAALLLIIIGVIIYFVKKKKEDSPANEEEENPDDYMPVADDNEMDMGFEDLPTDVMSEDLGTTVGFMEDDPNPTLPLSTPPISTPPISAPPIDNSSMEVTLVRLGKEAEGSYKVNVSGEVPIGRSASRSKLAFPEDKALSGIHCTLISKGRHLYIKDNASKNGTFVNGVPINGKHELEQDDVIIIGSYEYRVFWK
ncbi:MAG: FHA domain-containing protein [Lachnospiraceae bacterium]|nr:FHA domain-containing protein [Lachnospiraceae bacterium]